MALYTGVPATEIDAEKGDPAQGKGKGKFGGSGSAVAQLMSARWGKAALGGVSILLLVALTRGWSGGEPTVQRRQFGPPKRTSLSSLASAPNASTLLTSQAPARSFYDALRPDLRYLTLDSWSGMTGQFLTTLSLMYLAQQTQRIAILPSWRDADHYGDSMIKMGLLFDMEKYRQESGALFVDWDEVKPLDRNHANTDRDAIGCYMGNNAFEGGRSFDEHNLEQTIWRVPRSGGWYEHSVEAFQLFDWDEADRLKRTKEFAKENKRDLPPNMLNSQLLCYSNLWDLNVAGAHATGVRWYDGFGGQQRKDGGMKELLPISMRGTHPEWFAVGQFIDFHPDVWEIALGATLRTLKVKQIPENLITVHLRRGDFKEWCSTGHNCTPTLDAYVEKLEPLLALSPPGTPVLVTTDEQDDNIFLSSIDKLGWYRVDHPALGTFATLEAKYGEDARWVDAAVDQAILSLGSHFVGTSGSQVSLVTELRVAAWNGGETGLVERPS
ncbi:hypothetical protein JCM21900_005368 [Sporobolomyces salmonicolor]